MLQRTCSCKNRRRYSPELASERSKKENHSKGTFGFCGATTALQEAQVQLYAYSQPSQSIDEKEIEYSNVVGQDDLKRFDKSFKQKKQKTNRKKDIK